MRFRKSKEIGSSRVAATVAIDPADLLERGRAAATEVIEAALAAGHIETLRPTRKRHPGRKAALWIALGVTALTAAYIWWQRHDGGISGSADAAAATGPPGVVPPDLANPPAGDP